MCPWGTNRVGRDSRLTDSVVRHASGPPPTLPMIKAPVGNRGASVGAAGLPGGTVNGAPRPHNGTGRRAVQKFCRHWPAHGRTRRSHGPAPGSGCRKRRHGATSTRRSRSWPPGAPWFSRAAPGRTHDLSAARAHGIGQACPSRQILVLADRACQGACATWRLFRMKEAQCRQGGGCASCCCVTRAARAGACSKATVLETAQDLDGLHFQP